MTLRPGFFQSPFWPSNFWHEDYWQDLVVLRRILSEELGVVDVDLETEFIEVFAYVRTIADSLGITDPQVQKWMAYHCLVVSIAAYKRFIESIEVQDPRVKVGVEDRRISLDVLRFK